MAQFDENGYGIETDSKLRVRVHYSYSDVQRFESLLQEWHLHITDEIMELDLIKEYVENLTSPFGFLKAVVQQKMDELDEGDKEDLKNEREGDNQYHKQEKQYEEQLDATAKNIAMSMGYRQVPWLGITYFVLVI